MMLSLAAFFMSWFLKHWCSGKDLALLWLLHGCILEGISFLSISSILLPTRKSGIRRDKYLSAAIFKEAVHSDDS